MQQILSLYRNCLLAFASAIAFAGAATHSNGNTTGTRQPVPEHCYSQCIQGWCLASSFLPLKM